MRRFTLLSSLALLMLSACAPSAGAIQTAIAQTQAAGPASGVLASRLYKLLEEGSTLNAMTVQGVTFQEYRQQLARVKGAFSVALSAQSASASISPEVVNEMNLAFTGWDLALSVWDAKSNGRGAPHAPDAVRYPELVEYVGLDKLPFTGGVPGEGEVDQDHVIRILLARAMDHFTAAQDLVLNEMK